MSKGYGLTTEAEYQFKFVLRES